MIDKQGASIILESFRLYRLAAEKLHLASTPLPSVIDSAEYDKCFRKVQELADEIEFGLSILCCEEEKGPQ